MFLLPVGGIVDHRFGILTSPGHKGIPTGIVNGMTWAADNQCFTQEFNWDIFVDWLETMEAYRCTCLFVAVPDIVGDAKATLDIFAERDPYISGWPLAFVAQDGQEELEFPESRLWSTLFIGGTTEWKLSRGAVECIKRAQSLGKHIHIGRVNNWRRYSYFAGMDGAHEWTCDGTKTRFIGTENAVALWAGYMGLPRQLHLPIPGGHRDS